MKTTLTRESASKVRLSIEAGAAEVAPAIARAVRRLGSEVKVPGFRKGHVPRKVLESRLGADALREATLREAIPELLAKAVSGESVAPVAPPSVEVTSYSLDADLTFDATVEVMPEITLPNVELLQVTRPSSKATDEEIDSELRRLQDRFATLETVPRNARRGDYVLIDLHATLHGQEIKDLSGTDQLYEVGAGWPVPELDQELDGRRAGEIVQFNATVPASAGEHGGKELTFRALVKEVKNKVSPPLDEGFAKTASEFDTLDELRADIRKRIEELKRQRADAEVRNRVLEQAVEDAEIEPPESLVHREMAYRLERFEQQLQAAGITIDQYMQQGGFTEEQVESDLRRQAERNVRAQLLLDEIARREALEVSPDELKEEVRLHAQVLRVDPAQLHQQLGARDRLGPIAGDIIRRKALDHLVARAEIRDEDQPDEVSEKEATP